MASAAWSRSSSERRINACCVSVFCAAPPYHGTSGAFAEIETVVSPRFVRVHRNLANESALTFSGSAWPCGLQWPSPV